MQRWWAPGLTGLLLIAAGAISGLRPAAEAAHASEVRALEFSVVTPAGNTVELHFSVRADTSEAAFEAATAAARQLIPGAEFDAGDRASAAYAFWPWQWAAELLPVPVAYNPAGAPAGITEDAITAGIAPWNAVESSAFRIGYEGVTTAVPGLHADVLDGQNVIGWANMNCFVGCVLGITTKSSAAYEVDIVLNSNAAAGLGDGSGFSIDTTYVVLHELGHFAGLEHSCYPDEGTCADDEWEAVMFPFYRGNATTLGPDDIAGISALYPLEEDPVHAFPAPEPGTYVLELQAGWNLVVLPPGPLERSVGSLKCVDAVYALDANEWRVWLRDGARALNSLNSVDGSGAYWVHAEGHCVNTFTFTRED